MKTSKEDSAAPAAATAYAIRVFALTASLILGGLFLSSRAGAASPNPAVPGPVTGRIIVKLRGGLEQNLEAAVRPASEAIDLSSAGAADPKLASWVARFKIRSVKPLVPERVRARRQRAVTDLELSTEIKKRFPVRAARVPANEPIPDLSGIFVLDLGRRTKQDIEQAIALLRADPDVIYAEEDKVVSVNYVPNDPYFGTFGSWGQSYDDLYGLKKIGCAQAWDVTRGAGTVVAVIDSGIDYNHPDIRDNVWINPGEIPGNGIDDDRNGYIDDVRGWDFIGKNHLQPAEDNDPYDGNHHGTHVAGTIAATGDNGIGVVGVAWQAKVMAVKGLDDSGIGSDSILARAIYYAADNGADVINASWGRPGGLSQTTSDAINYAHALGVVFVAAAGNDTQDVSDYSPADEPAAITVAATTPNDTQANFSNFGDKIDVAAPGVDILSLQAGTSDYIRLQGTSMAAPHVSGVAALILARHPEFSVEQVRQALRMSATDLGAPGRDPIFGYGRLNAAQAVQLSSVLEAKILAPCDGALLTAPTELTVSARGPGFSRYVLDYNSDENPISWVTLVESSVPVINAPVGIFDPTTHPDGVYTIRLRVFDTVGHVYSDQTLVAIRYLAITSPAKPEIPVFTRLLRPGDLISVIGTAVGPSFQNYRLEWAPGANAITGWSAVGMTPTNNGQIPVTNGLLGTWQSPATLTAGDYTIRLVVANAGFSSQAKTLVYAEPDLYSNAWPLATVGQSSKVSVLPVHQGDGSIRLLLCGEQGSPLPFTSGGYWCRLFDRNGSVSAEYQLAGDSIYNCQPAVGNLDGTPDDEIVVAEGPELLILSSDLSLIRSIATPEQRRFGIDPVCIVDLDNDGVPEILAPARDVDANDHTMPSGAVYVFRPDGTLYSNHYPFVFTSPGPLCAVAVDLNGDNRKEIVVASTTYGNYSIQAFNADGTSYPGWTTTTFNADYLQQIGSADLDGDGRNEVILREMLVTGEQGDMEIAQTQIRVLEHNGVTRAGWPVRLNQFPGTASSCFAVGDLNRDGRNEIVVATESLLTVLAPDGTPFGAGWPVIGTSFATPVIADLDNDGYPEIVVGKNAIVSGPPIYTDSRLMAYRRDGSVWRQWRLFGINGIKPSVGLPIVGNLTGDGRTDIAVKINTSDIDTSEISLLTTGAAFNAPASDWPVNTCDAQGTNFVPPGKTATAGGPWLNTSMSSQAGTFSAAFDAMPSATPINAVVGLSSGTRTDYTGFAALVRFNPAGRIDARNGDAYAAASSVSYSAGLKYRFYAIVNVPARTYSVYVALPDGGVRTVASNFAFRTEQNRVTSLNNWGPYAGTGSVSARNFLAGTPASCVTASGSGWPSSAFMPQTGGFTALFQATPSTSPINAVLGLTSGAQSAYTGFSAYVRFNPAGRIDARNGGSFVTSSISYRGGTKYGFRLVVNLATHTYSAFVTPAGGTEQTIGTDLSFRTEQNTVTFLDRFGLHADTGSVTACYFTAGRW